MKSELPKSLNYTSHNIIKTSVFDNGNPIPKEKYIPSQKSIKALEIAYKKKVNENLLSEKILAAMKCQIK